ncbi:O-acetylhomoserine aminocarboxypropyltransferase/cysteine synthase family protein [Rhodocyclus gracilis]|uniref:Bifunctional O-acetylhomoserine aminocarboxypropyltransferase/cysteine synthase n=1 Tax=Rhodocyclus tenuis TaxID=1066 RepID=A0A6L5JZ79_RHOTE|nr:PLP-dependent transferase [Rhodocyclus gracilis]MQY52371.1 bifunctional O-acetylhomoserine aminocarboxypropyltransferase/cysteine synthase [Rhodocyclus gracilis]
MPDAAANFRPDHRFETLQVHAGQTPAPVTNARALPIYQTSSFTFNDSAHAARLFALEEEGNVYTRIFNPTSDVFERRIAALEGGVAAVAVGTHAAARFLAFNTLLTHGDDIVVSNSIGSETRHQLLAFERNFGIHARFVDDGVAGAFAPAIGPRTRAVYVETLAGAGLRVPDFAGIAEVAHAAGLPLLVDNTAGGGGYLAQPLAHGADVVIAATNRLIGGHGAPAGGVIIDGGRFDWSSGRFAEFTQPSAGYHGLRFWERFGPGSPTGNVAFAIRSRVEGARDIGPSLSPLSAFQFVIGLETLSLRAQRHADNALALAHWLRARPEVSAVVYPGLPEHPQHALARRYLPNGFGSELRFVLRGGGDAAARLLAGLELVGSVVNPDDGRTQIDTVEPENALSDGATLRLFAGLEHFDDLVADIDRALTR